MEHDGEQTDGCAEGRERQTGREGLVMIVNAGSNADGAVGVSLKFHLEHPRAWLARLDRRRGLLRVCELGRRRRPEDDRSVRARAVTGSLRRHRVR